MASKAMWPQVLEARRKMVTLVARKAEAAAKAADVQMSMLPSGLKVASIDSNAAAVSTVGMLVRSGSMHEKYDNLGASHAVRLNVGLGTKHATGFGVVRNVQQVGGHLDVIGSREYTLYTLSAPRTNIADAFDFFCDAVTAPAFKPWEQNDQIPQRMAFELANLDGPAKAVELLHKAAYRNGLGNSLYAPDYMVGKFKPDMLRDFHSQTHTFTRSILVGYGLDHLTLSRFGEAVHLGKGHGPSVPGKYFGGEARDNGTGSQAFVAIAVESAACSSNAKESLANLILRNVLGTGPRVLRGDGRGKLDKAVAEVAGNKSVAGLNYSYSDTALTGAFVAAEASNVGQVVTQVIGALRNLSVSEEELKAAKKALQIEVAEQSIDAKDTIEAIGAHALFGVQDNAGSLEEMIAMLSLSDVQAAAKKISSGKLSMGASGNLGSLPYVDTL